MIKRQPRKQKIDEKNENKEKTLWLASLFLNENWGRENAFNIGIILEKKGSP